MRHGPDLTPLPAVKLTAEKTKGVPWIAWLLFAAALGSLLLLFWFIANLDKHARGRKGGHVPKDTGAALLPAKHLSKPAANSRLNLALDQLR